MRLKNVVVSGAATSGRAADVCHSRRARTGPAEGGSWLQSAFIFRRGDRQLGRKLERREQLRRKFGRRRRVELQRRRWRRHELGRLRRLRRRPLDEQRARAHHQLEIPREQTQDQRGGRPRRLRAATRASSGSGTTADAANAARRSGCLPTPATAATIRRSAMPSNAATCPSSCVRATAITTARTTMGTIRTIRITDTATRTTPVQPLLLRSVRARVFLLRPVVLELRMERRRWRHQLRERAVSGHGRDSAQCEAA